MHVSAGMALALFFIQTFQIATLCARRIGSSNGRRATMAHNKDDAARGFCSVLSLETLFSLHSHLSDSESPWR